MNNLFLGFFVKKNNKLFILELVEFPTFKHSNIFQKLLLNVFNF
jgi:hypothetical protein